MTQNAQTAAELPADSLLSESLQPKPKRQGVKNYPASTFVTLFEELKSIEAVAVKLNVSYTTVLRYLRKAGAYEPRYKPRKIVDYPLDLFVRLRRDEKLTIEQIAERLDISQKTVCKRLRRAGYNKVGKVQAPRRELYLSLQKQGMSNAQIAEECGVLEETVRQMLINVSGGAVGTRRRQPIADRYISLFKAGKTIHQIADECGTAYVTVAKSLRLHGMTKSGLFLPKPTFSIELPSY